MGIQVRAHEEYTTDILRIYYTKYMNLPISRTLTAPARIVCTTFGSYILVDLK